MESSLRAADQSSGAFVKTVDDDDDDDDDDDEAE